MQLRPALVALYKYNALLIEPEQPINISLNILEHYGRNKYVITWEVTIYIHCKCPRYVFFYCNSMPLVRLGLTICLVKSSYFLMQHRLYKITLLFCLGGSHQSLKVREVKCIPGDPATTCPVLFKGSCSPLLLA